MLKYMSMANSKNNYCTVFKVKYICGGQHDLVPFEQFKKRERYPWRSVIFSRVTKS